MVANGFGCSTANLRPATTTAPDGTALRFVSMRDDAPLAMGLVMAEDARAALIIRAYRDLSRAGIAKAILSGPGIGRA